jgi:hypothetical protein
MKTNFTDSFDSELKMLNHLDLFDNSTNNQTPLISEQNDEEENTLFLLDSEESENEEQPMDINEEQTTLSHKNRIVTSSNTIRFPNFSNEEICHLLAGVKIFSTKNWNGLLEHFKHVFHQSRDSNSLHKKYNRISNRESFEEEFKERIEEIYNKNKDLIIEKKTIYWSQEETCYLLAGVELCGKGNWTEILNRFKEKFDKP